MGRQYIWYNPHRPCSMTKGLNLLEIVGIETKRILWNDCKTNKKSFFLKLYSSTILCKKSRMNILLVASKWLQNSALSCYNPQRTKKRRAKSFLKFVGLFVCGQKTTNWSKYIISYPFDGYWMVETCLEMHPFKWRLNHLKLERLQAKL